MSDILLLSLGTTIGLRASDRELARAIREAGASVELAGVRVGAAGALRRAYPVTDLVEALAARRALAAALPRVRPHAVIFSTTTSSLVAADPGVPYAIRLDAPARLNRPGARNALQHALERRRMRNARLVLPASHAAAAALPRGAAPAVVLHESIVASGEPAAARRRLAVTYTPDPKAKGLDIVVAAWAGARIAGAQLEVFGIAAERARAFLARRGLAEPAGVSWRGRVGAAEFRASLRRAHVFVSGARWEDFGRAQLEALADGALLVCGPTRGACESLAHARALAPALCAGELLPQSLATALRAAFAFGNDELARYRREAAERLLAYRPAAAAALISERVLPALLS